MASVAGYLCRPLYPEIPEICPACKTHHRIVSVHQNDYNALNAKLGPTRRDFCHWLNDLHGWANILLPDENVAIICTGL